MRTIRPSIIVASGLVAATLLGSSAVAVATISHHPAAHQATVHVWVEPGKGAAERILLAGGIGDVGRAISETKNGTVTAHGHYVDVKLQQGSFMVNAVAFNKIGSKGPLKLTKSTCSAYETFSGPVTLYDGTGAYAGISGKIRMTESYALLANRFTSGPHKGSCDLANSAKPKAVFQSTLQGVGTVTL